MIKILSLSIVSIAAIVDLATFIFIFIFGVKSTDINHEIFQFTFGTSLFDLLIWSCIRFCLLFGGCLGIIYNGVAGVQRVKRTSKLMVYFGCAFSIYCVMKIMYFTEDSKGNMGKRVWTMIGVSIFTCLTQYSCWKVLGCIRIKRTIKLSINVGDNISNSSEDSDSDDNDDESDDENDENLNVLDKEASKKYTTFVTAIKLLKMSKNDVPYLILAFVFLVGCSIGQIFLPYYTGKVVNYIVIEKSTKKFKEAMLYMVLITVAAGFASGMRAGIFQYVYTRYEFRVQNLLFKSIMNMEIGFFDIRKTGEITSRLTSDCTKMGDGISLNLNVFLRNVVKIIGVLFFMIKLSWKLSIVTLVSVPVIAIISELFGDKYRKLSEQVQNSLANANESAEEAISSIRTVRSFAGEEEEVERYSKCLRKTYNIRKKECVIMCGYRWCTEITDLTMSLVVLYFGGHLVMQNDLSGGNLVSFILYSIEIGYAFEEISDVYTGLMEAVGASKNVLVYIERKPEIKTDGNLSSEESIIGNVQFKDVSFSYPSRKDIPVLKKINFSVSKGEVVALVGPSGGGKSSIVNLLEHFYEPTSGQVLIDNINVKEYNHKFIHTKMSLVQQEPVLFARTISENISYGLDPSPDENLIKSSAIMANAHGFIADMPKSYETQTGEKGIQLSGGQKQRVAIARALIRDPSILILDEATSALDSESEYLVQQAINKNLTGRSVLVIAHRLSTVEKADKIIVIEKGEIVEEGKHLELINRDGVYAGLVKRQLLGVDDVQIKPIDQTKYIRQQSNENRGHCSRLSKSPNSHHT